MLWECFECDFVLSDDLSEPVIRNEVVVVRLLTGTCLRYFFNNIDDRRVLLRVAYSPRDFYLVCCGCLAQGSDSGAFRLLLVLLVELRRTVKCQPGPLSPMD